MPFFFVIWFFTVDSKFVLAILILFRQVQLRSSERLKLPLGKFAGCGGVFGPRRFLFEHDEPHAKSRAWGGLRAAVGGIASTLGSRAGSQRWDRVTEVRGRMWGQAQPYPRPEAHGRSYRPGVGPGSCRGAPSPSHVGEGGLIRWRRQFLQPYGGDTNA